MLHKRQIKKLFLDKTKNFVAELILLLIFLNTMELKFIAIGLMAFGLLGSAFAIGHVFSALLSGIARNPEAEEKMSKYAYVGAGFAESIGLFALLISLILIFS